MDYFYSTDAETQINRIILSGGGAHIESFRHLLAAETSTEVEVINPITNIELDNKNTDSAFLEQIAPQAAICLGLALRRINDK